MNFKRKPVTHPGENTVYAAWRLPSQIDIIRTVAGLALPVRCTIIQRFSVGSCSNNDVYKDVMQDITEITSSNSPADLAD